MAIDFPLSFNRQYSGPLDSSLVFDNHASLTTYAADPTAYAGQIVAVTSDGVDSRNTLYILQDVNGSLEPIVIPKNPVISDSISTIVQLTQAEYDAIGTPDTSILYVISG